jgi:hypothetical protein
LNSLQASSFYVRPIRTATSSGNNLIYDTTTGEILYGSVPFLQTKTFIIDHPDDRDKYLVHACLEGPDVGVYYRGTDRITNNESVVVELPPYVKSLATDFTVHLTQVYNENECTSLVCSEVENNRFTVYGDNCEFFWVVHGKRGTIDVEPLKTDVVVEGEGPYKWIQSTFEKSTFGKGGAKSSRV